MATLVTKPERTAQEHADALSTNRRALFMSKDMRDSVAAILASEGVTVRKSSVRGQQLHPEYVTDYVGSYHTGFGNTDYQTFWSVLYEITVS